MLIGPSIYGIIIGHFSRPPTRFVSSLVVNLTIKNVVHDMSLFGMDIRMT